MIFNKIIQVSANYKIFFAMLLGLGAFISIFSSSLRADIIFFKDGRKLEGIVKKETPDFVELDLGFGKAKFEKAQIDHVQRSGPAEIAQIKSKWNVKEPQTQNQSSNSQQQSQPSEEQTKTVKVYGAPGRIYVDANVNGKSKMTFILDTGAPLVYLSEEKAAKLGIKISKSSDRIKIRGFNGQVEAVPITLKSIKIQSVEMNDVPAAVFLQDILGPEKSVCDGLLGMSFLANFNFKIDYKNNKVTFEKLKR